MFLHYGSSQRWHRIHHFGLYSYLQSDKYRNEFHSINVDRCTRQHSTACTCTDYGRIRAGVCKSCVASTLDTIGRDIMRAASVSVTLTIVDQTAVYTAALEETRLNLVDPM